MNKPEILIIDDEVAFAESLSIALKDDFNVLTALNGTDGLSVVKGQNLSLILLDLHMPGMTGVEVLKNIREINPDLPVIIITGKGSYEWAKRCADLNVQGFMEKPVDVEELVKKINEWVKRDNDEYMNVLHIIRGNTYNKVKVSSLSPTVQRILSYIHRNYQKDFSRDGITAELGLSPDYISRQFRKECCCTLKDFVNSFRIYKSIEYLTKSDKKIKDIATEVGISDLNYFCRLFKKHTGYTPESFRK